MRDKMRLFWYFASSGAQFLVLENLLKNGVPKLFKLSKILSVMSISLLLDQDYDILGFENMSMGTKGSPFWNLGSNHEASMAQ